MHFILLCYFNVDNNQYQSHDLVTFFSNILLRVIFTVLVNKHSNRRHNYLTEYISSIIYLCQHFFSGKHIDCTRVNHNILYL